MKTSFTILLFIIFFQLDGQAWPNNLVYTLTPVEGVDLKNNTLGFELIEENTGKTFIGKFKKLHQAEVAQQRLSDVGVKTEMCAFFRAEQINLEDAKILSANMNLEEESTMLSGTTTRVWPGKIMNDEMNQEKSNRDSKSENPIPDTKKEANNTFYTIQLGVFSKSAKHKYKIEVNERVINEKYYCFFGQYFSIDDAKKELITMKNKGYNDAFITGFDRGNKVSPKVVKEILNSL